MTNTINEIGNVCKLPEEEFVLPAGILCELEGPICAGKSTMLGTFKKYCKYDSNHIAVTYYEEQIDMDMIEEYKRRLRTCVDQNEMMKWSMDLQTNIMLRREDVLQKASSEVAKGRTVVIERGTLGNLVFALNALSKFISQPDTMKLFSQYILRLVNEIIKRSARCTAFDLTIYLKTPIEESIRRNKLRDAEAYDPEYLCQLQSLYELMLTIHLSNEMVIFDMEKINTELGYKSVFDMVERDLARSASQMIYKRPVLDHLIKDIWQNYVQRTRSKC